MAGLYCSIGVSHFSSMLFSIRVSRTRCDRSEFLHHGVLDKSFSNMVRSSRVRWAGSGRFESRLLGRNLWSMWCSTRVCPAWGARPDCIEQGAIVPSFSTWGGARVYRAWAAWSEFLEYRAHGPRFKGMRCLGRVCWVWSARSKFFEHKALGLSIPNMGRSARV